MKELNLPVATVQMNPGQIRNKQMEILVRNLQIVPEIAPEIVPENVPEIVPEIVLTEFAGGSSVDESKSDSKQLDGNTGMKFTNFVINDLGIFSSFMMTVITTHGVTKCWDENYLESDE